MVAFGAAVRTAGVGAASADAGAGGSTAAAVRSFAGCFADVDSSTHATGASVGGAAAADAASAAVNAAASSGCWVAVNACFPSNACVVRGWCTTAGFSVVSGSFVPGCTPSAAGVIGALPRFSGVPGVTTGADGLACAASSAATGSRGISAGSPFLPLAIDGRNPSDATGDRCAGPRPTSLNTLSTSATSSALCRSSRAEVPWV
mmetsp:Transcript_85298/g.164253  ORF Transcript_85298/g.164253 Transcript_85298/m.164253 type:complete len:204 (-) Transcript_85298:460-1071(-)